MAGDQGMAILPFPAVHPRVIEGVAVEEVDSESGDARTAVGQDAGGIGEADFVERLFENAVVRCDADHAFADVEDEPLQLIEAPSIV